LLGLRDASHSSTTYHVGRGASTNKPEEKIKRTRAFIAKPSSCSLRIPTNMLGVDWILGLANEVWDTVTTRFHHLICKPMRGFRETSVFFDKLLMLSNCLTFNTPWREESGSVTSMRGCSYSHIIKEEAGRLVTL